MIWLLVALLGQLTLLGLCLRYRWTHRKVFVVRLGTPRYYRMKLPDRLHMEFHRES